MNDSPFALAFRQHVKPRLKQRCLFWGAMLAVDECDYGHAHAEVMAYARKYGSLHLPDEIYYQLEDWVGAELLHAMLAAEVLAEEVAANPAPHLAKIAKEAGDPVLTWTMAAACPEFRRHVIRKARNVRN